MVARKVANPALPMLATVNPKRGKKMAAKKRKGGGKRIAARSHSKAKPRWKPAKRATSRRTHSRAPNPVKRTRRSHTRRHTRRARRYGNPLGIPAGEVFNFTVAGIGLGLFQPIVTRFVGGMLPFGQYNTPILSAGSGWLLSKGMEMFSFTRRFARPTLIFGLATAAMQVLQPIVRGAIGASGAGNPTMSGWQRRPQPMRGIGVVTGIPPGIAPMPPPLPAGKQMAGVGIRPGNWGR